MVHRRLVLGEALSRECCLSVRQRQARSMTMVCCLLF
jgi:hypothetical protein